MMIKLPPIRTEAEYKAALTEVELLWCADIGTPEGDRLNTLVDLIVAYERERWPVEDIEDNEGGRTLMNAIRAVHQHG